MPPALAEEFTRNKQQRQSSEIFHENISSSEILAAQSFSRHYETLRHLWDAR